MPEVLQIEPRYLAMLLEIFEGHFNQEIPLEVLAYGSRLTPYHHPGSDLDLVARRMDNSEKPILEILEVIEQIRESNIPILVDLFDWAYLPTHFKQEIERKCLRIWRTSGHAHSPVPNSITAAPQP